MYKIIHGLVAIKINRVFFNFSNETRTRSSHRLKLLEPYCKKDVLKFLFSQDLLETGINFSLHDMPDITSLVEFKNCLSSLA